MTPISLACARACRLVPLLVFAACGSDATRADGPELRILTTELPPAALTTTYSATLVAQGGVAPYVWAVASGALPSGLTLNAASGVISGTPAQQGTFSFVTQVRDALDSTVVRQLSLNVSTTSVADVTIALNGATYQTWRAWRFSVRGNKDVDGDCSRTSDAVADAYLTDVVDNLGFTGIRLAQHYLQGLEATANDNADPFNLNMAGFVGGLDAPLVFNNCPVYARADMIDRTVVPMRNRVLARGEPFDLYISFIYFQFSRLPAWWRNDPDEGAEAVEAYVTWFRQHYGFAPDWFTHNEPDGGHFGASRWMGHLTVALGQRFARLGVSTKIEQPSSSTPGGAISAFDNIAGVAGATALVRRVGFHGYDYYNSLWPDATGIKNRNDLRTRARAIGAETVMSEICCKPGWDGGYNTGLALARDIYLNMVEADVSIWEPLGIYSICKVSGCSGSGTAQNLVNIDPSLSTYYFNPVFWVVRQFSRYIRPGDVRVGLDCSGCTATADRGPALKAVAWQSPSHKLVMILLNDSGAALTTTVTGIGSGPLELNKLDPSMCRTSGPRDRCTPVATTATSNGSITVTLPPDAVWTLRQP